MYRLSLLSIATVSTIALTQMASAADLPRKAPVYTPPPPAVISWTGFYIGGDIGGARMSSQNYTFADPGNAAFDTCGNCIVPYQNQVLSGGSDSSIIGGLYLGYNWQFAPTWLVGVEGDFSWTGLKKSVNGPLLSDSGSSSTIIPVAGSNLSFQTEVQWLATLRARLGWLIQPNWLVYATGGAAWAHADVSANATCPVSTLDGCGLSLLSGAAFSSSTTLTGYVVGGGVEWQIPMTALGGHWRARVEYLYHGFNQSQSGSALFVNGTGAPVACNITPTCSALYGLGDFNIQTVRAGLGYAF